MSQVEQLYRMLTHVDMVLAAWFFLSPSGLVSLPLSLSLAVTDKGLNIGPPLSIMIPSSLIIYPFDVLWKSLFLPVFHVFLEIPVVQFSLASPSLNSKQCQ